MQTYEGAYREKQDTLFTMHDLVHDLAVLLLGDEIMDQRQQGNTLSSSCRYALLTDSSKPLELCLSSCARLTALRFIDCRRTELCGAAFAPANFLRVLDLRECHIQKLPESIGQLQQLSYLKAPEIQDQLIPDCITQLSKLNYLYINESEISALPESIGEMAGLVHLDISFCSEIEQLPLSFRNLENLVHLDLSHCSLITGVSESLGSLRRLQHLDLRWCTSIGEELPGALGSLTELQYLNLSHCSYLQVPDTEVLGNLRKLKYLNLSSASSPLRRLPESLGSFTELECLDLSGCRQLEELPASFGKLCSLVHLNLSDCFCLNNIWDALRDLTKLQCLNLSQCSIDVFRQRQHVSSKFLQEAMNKLIELRFLNLSNSVYFCGSQSVSDSFLEWISNLTNLEHLDLSGNSEFHTVPDALGKLKKLHTLDLSYCRYLLWLPKSISENDSLKFLNTMGCDELNKSTLPQFNSSSVLLPHFVVRTGDGEHSSNLVLLKDEDPTVLEISSLENVKSVEEAKTVKLLEKRMIYDLKFEWTRDAKRFVEDIEVLTELVPPCNVQSFFLQGYNSLTFPSWMMGITSYLPQLSYVSLKELPWCSALPPLGQLPNLGCLVIKQMHSIREIGRDLYGGTRAFQALMQFHLEQMDNLQEWNTIGYSDEDGGNVLVLPMLRELVISQCPILRFKPCPPIGGDSWHIGSSDNAISLGGESVHVEASFSSNVLHQCRLVLHLPALKTLWIENCSDMTSSSLDILRGLSSLETLVQLHISNCPGIKRLPESIKQLTNLQTLNISDCPELVQWCESDEKIMKLLRTSK